MLPWVVAAATVFGGGAATFWLSADREPRLIHVAHPVDRDPELFSTQTEYMWDSQTAGHSVNTFHSDKGPDIVSIIQFDARSGRHKWLHDLPPAANSLGFQRLWIATPANYILARDPLNADFSTARAFDFTGKQLCQWKVNAHSYNDVIFTRSGSPWIEIQHFRNITRAVEHSFTGENTNIVPGLHDEEWLGEDLKGNLLGLNQQDSNYPWKLDLYNKSNLSFPIRTVTLPVSRYANIEAAELAPSADRLLLWVKSGGDIVYPSILGILNRRFRWVSGPSEWVLYTYDLNGGLLHKIGCMPACEDAGGVVGLHWMPDSKSISFVNHGWLFEVPAL